MHVCVCQWLYILMCPTNKQMRYCGVSFFLYSTVESHGKWPSVYTTTPQQLSLAWPQNTYAHTHVNGVCACLQKWLTSLAVMCLVTPFKCYASQWSVCVHHVTALLVPASLLLISRSVLGWDEVGHDWHTRKQLRWKLRERVQRIMRRSGRTQKRNVREHVHIVQCDVCYLLMCFTV